MCESCKDDEGFHGYHGNEMIEDQGTEVKTTKIKNNLVSQGLQRGQTRELGAERGSRQEFLQVVNSQRDR